ncbi:hypothetical protein B0F88_1182 [Methylobacter tundripaludum]|uniref:Uncharacterized protein n=1 Tax=Methylobacter tundripaludum TaxID=173365 RepID=A0A2S6GLA3_9GAMM|nr:hypothetical protein B0F88_1182 [Methylobacter tundripaludum]
MNEVSFGFDESNYGFSYLVHFSLLYLLVVNLK